MCSETLHRWKLLQVSALRQVCGYWLTVELVHPLKQPLLVWDWISLCEHSIRMFHCLAALSQLVLFSDWVMLWDCWILSFFPNIQSLSCASFLSMYNMRPHLWYEVMTKHPFSMTCHLHVIWCRPLWSRAPDDFALQFCCSTSCFSGASHVTSYVRLVLLPFFLFFFLHVPCLETFQC